MKRFSFLLYLFLILGGEFYLLGSSCNSYYRQGTKDRRRFQKIKTAYREKLGEGSDIYRGAFTRAEHKAIYQKALVRDGKKSPLGIVDFLMRNKSIQGKSLELYLKKFLKILERDFYHPIQNKRVLRENMFAIEKAAVIFKNHEKNGEQDREREDLDESSQNKEKESSEGGEDQETMSKVESDGQKGKVSEKNNPQGKGGSHKQEFSQLPSQYTPKTKDINEEESSSLYEILRTSVHETYFVQRYYHHIRRGEEYVFGENTMEGDMEAERFGVPSSHFLEIFPLGKRRLDIFLPVGFVPLDVNYKDFKVKQKRNGEFSLYLYKDLERVKINIGRQEKKFLSSWELRPYEEKVGVSDHEWPEEVQVKFVRRKKTFKKSESLEVAKEIESYLRTNFSYSKKDMPEKDPVEALKVGSFQCDMASYIMVSILRDIFSIPSRIGGGYIGEPLGGSDLYTVKLPSEPHVWVEVFHHGIWHKFDPTPIGENSGDLSQHHENQSSMKKSDDGEVDQGEGSGKTGEEALLDPKGSDEENTLGLEKDSFKENKTLESEDFDGEKSTGVGTGDISLSGIQKIAVPESRLRNIFIYETVRNLLKKILSPFRDSRLILEDIQNLDFIFRLYSFNDLKRTYQRSFVVADFNHPHIKSWFQNIKVKFNSMSSFDLYQNIYHFRESLSLFLELHKPEEISRNSLVLMEDLNRILMGMKSQAETKELAIGHSFYEKQSMAMKKYLNIKYGISSSSSRKGIHNLGVDILDGKLNHIRLIEKLSVFSKVVFDPFETRRLGESRAWYQDGKIKRGRDILPVRDFSFRPRAFKSQPHKSMADNIREGTAFQMVRRKRTISPLRGKLEDKSSMSIILYDTSASMKKGGAQRFQSALISSLIASALSETNTLGENNHQVLVIPFDSETGTPLRFSQPSDMFKILENNEAFFQSTDGGTNIEGALIGALDLIAKSSLEGIKRANILLLTDGGGEVNFSTIKEKRDSIRGRVPVELMYFSIRGFNKDLARLAGNPRKGGLDKAHYRYFDQVKMMGLFQQSRSLKFSENEEVYFDEFSEINKNHLKRSWIELEEKISRFVSEYERESYDLSYLNIKIPPGKRGEKNINEFEEDLIALRKFLKDPVFKNKPWRKELIKKFFKDFEKTSEKRIESLSFYELEQLRKLKDEIEGEKL